MYIILWHNLQAYFQFVLLFEENVPETGTLREPHTKPRGLNHAIVTKWCVKAEPG